MELNSKIYVSGHNGMVGSAIVRELKRHGYTNIIGKTHLELDLTRQKDVEEFFAIEHPEYVFLAAAKVGGIAANINAPADFLMNNLQIQCNVIESARKNKVKKLMFLGSSCIYPKQATQPIVEESLLTGLLEPTNEGYAIAKIAGLKQCEFCRKQYGCDFISVMPCNIYGSNDNFDENSSHIIPAMIRKFHLAKKNHDKTVKIWGTGKVYRELLFVDDMASACVFLMNNYSDDEFLNIGYGKDYTVRQIATMIKKIVGFDGDILMDPTKPEGMFRKIVDSKKINAIGWSPSVSFEDGLIITYKWFLENVVE